MSYKLNIYLYFDGNCEEAMTFYKDTLNTEFIGGVMKMKDAPDKMNVPESELNRVMHIAMPVGDNVVMASDTFSVSKKKFIEGTNQYLSLGVDSKAEADRVYSALSKGGNAAKPMNQEFFGYYGELTDKFGIQWIIIYDGANNY